MRKLTLATALLLLPGLCAAARADVSVDASKIVRARPLGVGGTVIDAHNLRFNTNADGIDYPSWLKKANVKMVRALAYPDARFPTDKDGKVKDIAWFDARFQAIQGAGATPLFIHYIKPPEKLDVDLYLKSDGTPGGTIESDFVWQVKHFMAPPFNLKKQVWEVGNEPDLKIDYQVSSPDEYCDVFNRIHKALVEAGVRDNVVLCGPVISYPYQWTNLTLHTAIMDDFLDKCRDSVDIVTYHNYVGAGNLNGPMFNHKLENMEDPDRVFLIDRKTGLPKEVYGTPALLAKMKDIKFGRPDVGVGLTEHNVNSQRNRVTRGIWNLAVTHYYLYNPRGQITTSFVFDHYGGNQGGLGHFDDQKQPDFSYWALWMRGNLTGDQILSQSVTQNAAKSSYNKDGRPFLIATASKDAKNVYVEVINRDMNVVKDHVDLNNAKVGAPTIHVMAEAVAPSDDAAVKTVPAPWKGPVVSDKGAQVAAILPDKGTLSELGSSFDYEFPALSATVFVFPIVK